MTTRQFARSSNANLGSSALQFSENLYRVPLTESCAVLRDRYDMFSKRPSATAPSDPAPLLVADQGVPKVCPPTSP